MMLNQMGENSRLVSLYAALCMGYTVSFVVPRLGEVSRALIIKKTDNVKVDFTLISIIAERLYDMLALFVLIIINFILYNQLFLKLISIDQLMNMLPTVGFWFWFVMLFILIIVILLFRFLARKNWWRALVSRYKPVVIGLKQSSFKIQFWILTVGIWFCYYLMTYLWFFLFDETSHLTWQNALLIMTVGSFGRSIPVQGGGMGAYHFIVSRAFVIMGLSLVTGNAMAIVIHGAQAIFTLVTGVLSYGWMLYDVKMKRDNIQTN